MFTMKSSFDGIEGTADFRFGAAFRSIPPFAPRKTLACFLPSGEIRKTAKRRGDHGAIPVWSSARRLQETKTVKK